VAVETVATVCVPLRPIASITDRPRAKERMKPSVSGFAMEAIVHDLRRIFHP
jgi:hypothetical protein